MAVGGAGRAAAAAASVLMFATSLQAVTIERLSVPALVELDTGKPFLLECQYRVADAADLSVEWYFKPAEVNSGGGRRGGGGAPELVYRYRAPAAPEVFGVLRDKIEVNTEEEPMQSRLRVTQPDVRLSGEYTCAVSAAGGSARATRTLLLYSGEHDLRLDAQRRDREGVVDLSCSVDNVYPEPDLRLERLDSPNPPIQLPQRQRIQESDSGDGLLDARTTAQLSMSELRNRERFLCRLSLKHTSYQAKRELNFRTRSQDIRIEQISVTAQTPVSSTSHKKNGATQLTLASAMTVLSAAVTLLALPRI